MRRSSVGDYFDDRVSDHTSELSYEYLPPPRKKRFIASIKTEGHLPHESSAKDRNTSGLYGPKHNAKENDITTNEPLDMTTKQLESGMCINYQHTAFYNFLFPIHNCS